MKKTYFNRHEDIAWHPQYHNFGSTAEAGGFTTGAAAPAINMLEEVMQGGRGTVRGKGRASARGEHRRFANIGANIGASVG